MTTTVLTPTTKTLIAGPCSAETREQVLAVAEGLQGGHVDYFRAGIWKPRTRPGSFEGVGTEGLDWLREVKQTYGFKVCTEVANVKHVYEALKSGIDMVWIGARTSANPFAVQEIAEALQGVDIPVMVKNPVNADLNLWRGAIERIARAGISDIAGIHRGFSRFGAFNYRNEPKWQIPIGLKQSHPEIPIICDPSHIGGKRAFVQPISQKAMDLDFDGLMIETHTTPDQAWSDASQQVTPADYHALVAGLKLPKVSPKQDSQERLAALRGEIDDFDNQLLDILRNRMEVVQRIAEFKKQHNMTILQKARWSAIEERNAQLAAEFALEEKFVNQLFKAIHQGSIDRQERVMRE